MNLAPPHEALTRAAGRRRLPRATYRFQLGPELDLRQAAALVPYLDDLGISDVYLSPILKAGRGSTHGYDICDHGRINPGIGGEEAFEELSAALRARGMGLLLDLVPNHMGIADPANAWWMDVLENGQSSRYAETFDIDWRPLKAELNGKVLLPILEDQYGAVLEAGMLRLAYDTGGFFLHYHEHRMPIAPRSYREILMPVAQALHLELGPDDPHTVELQSILTALGYLPPRRPLPPHKAAERNREKEIVKRRIAALGEACPAFMKALEAVMEKMNGETGRPESFDALDRLIELQVYRPAFWKVATEEINYRRFFDINTLAAIRVERPEVFEATHRLILRLAAEGKVTGLRIDHPDGLWDPADYLRCLQQAYLVRVAGREQGEARAAADPPLEEAAACRLDGLERERERGAREAGWPLYVVVEKILVPGEPLPAEWAVEGTTGYEFLNAAGGLQIDPAARKTMDRIYAQFVGAPQSWRQIVQSSKKMIMLVSLAGEVASLARRLERITESDRRLRDFTLGSLTFAIREVIAALPVYRTYITQQTEAPSDRDRRAVAVAIAEVRARNPRTAGAVFDFLGAALLLKNRGDFNETQQAALIDFIMHLQQTSSPIMAKGVEDTAFYVYNRLASLCEVGGAPDRFGTTPEQFHAENAERRRMWPGALLATATHDNKRGEDTRARVNVLSELAGEWRAALGRWARRNNPRRTWLEDGPAPDRNDEYLLYQIMVGAWPEGELGADAMADWRGRLVAYMEKATREAKVHTSWIHANENYDQAVREFTVRLFESGRRPGFLEDLRAFQGRVAWFGRFAGLAQLLLKLAAPGVPDIYQGCELWDLNLVDPDNRRPVDWDLRRRYLGEIKARTGKSGGDLRPLAAELLAHPEDGRVKLYLLHQGLILRRERPHLFALGDYMPLESHGARRDHVVAFARRRSGDAVIAVVPRLIAGLLRARRILPLGVEVWEDTWLELAGEAPGGRWRDRLTGVEHIAADRGGAAALALADLMADFPVALLEKQ